MKRKEKKEKRKRKSYPTMAPSYPLLQSITGLDASISLRLHTFFQFIPRFLLKSLEISGDGRLCIPILVSLLFLLSPSFSSPHPLFISLLIGSLLDLAVIGLLKHLIRRPRPIYNKSDMTIVVSLDHYSFPSGHSSRVFFMFAFFFLSMESFREVLKEERLRNWVSGFGGDLGLDPIEVFAKVVLVWAVATSASRVLLGRHFVADVAVGACLGLIEGWIAYRFVWFW
ncbi:hypothetical protein LUZ60_016809 [Juncus effusus]|nr:hypothetical protein LUZ60_016809 [Juncus effusus]